MNRVRSQQMGYTIVELLIVLAVTGLLFVSAAMLINGQQQKTQFIQSVRDFESQLQDIANDVSTGYYVNTNDFTCIDTGIPGAHPVITASAGNNQGSNQGCIFAGRAIQISPLGSNKASFANYTIVGKQYINAVTGRRVTKDIDDAKPTTTPTPVVAAVNGGITMEWARFNAGGIDHYIPAFAFFTTFGSAGNGSLNVDLVPLEQNIAVPDTTPVTDLSTSSISSLISGLNNTSAASKNPPAGIEICLQSNGSNQHAVVVVGGNNRQLSSQATISGGPC